MIGDPATQEALAQIFPLLPWALDQMQVAIDPLVFADLEPGTKASITHNLVMKEGARRFAELRGIDAVNSSGLMHFALPDVLIRIKHARPGTLRIAINRTAQTLAWTSQLPLQGMTDPRDRLHLVYVPDALWTKITRSIVAIYRGDVAKDWRDIDVDAWYEAGGSSIEPFTPDVKAPPLKLKPGIVALPLEEMNGIA